VFDDKYESAGANAAVQKKKPLDTATPVRKWNVGLPQLNKVTWL
jgi:hypothetical protein